MQDEFKEFSQWRIQLIATGVDVYKRQGRDSLSQAQSGEEECTG